MITKPKRIDIMILTTFQTTVFLSYLAMVFIVTKRLLPSISESWYQLGGKKHLFSLFCILIGFSMLFQTDGSTGWYFMAGAGICFTGVAAEFKSKAAHTNIVHYVGALFFILGSLLGLYFESGLLWPLVFAILGVLVMGFFKIRFLIFWAEVYSASLIIAGLYSR